MDHDPFPFDGSTVNRLDSLVGLDPEGEMVGPRPTMGVHGTVLALHRIEQNLRIRSDPCAQLVRGAPPLVAQNPENCVIDRCALGDVGRGDGEVVEL